LTVSISDRSLIISDRSLIQNKSEVSQGPLGIRSKYPGAQVVFNFIFWCGGVRN